MIRSNCSGLFKRERATRRKMRQPELALQKAVREFLNVALPADVFWTAFPAGGGGAAHGARLKAGGLVSGVPDIWILAKGKSYFVELKSEKGRLQDNQKATAARLLKAGAMVFVCRSLLEVEHDLKTAGLPLSARAM